jgi:hypothetical protein
MKKVAEELVIEQKQNTVETPGSKEVWSHEE